MIRAAVLGGVDGIITSFAIVAATRAGTLGDRTVSVVGFASLLADGTSMGVSTYLAESAERALQDGRQLQAALSGAVCFGAFVTCGAVPLVVALYVESLVSSAAFSLVALMLLGAARTRATGEPLLRGFFETTLLGAAAGGVAYGVGALVAG